MESKQDLIDKLSSYELEIEDLKAILLKNFIDSNGNIDISGLDFSNFSGDVTISNMIVCNSLIQSNHKARDIVQEGHTVLNYIDQCFHTSGGDINQSWHRVNGDVNQNEHKVKGDIYQMAHEVDGRIYEGCYNVLR